MMIAGGPTEFNSPRCGDESGVELLLLPARLEGDDPLEPPACESAGS